MRRLSTLLVLVVLVAACAGADEPAERVAAQAERVATLLEQDQDCRALEAAVTLQALAEDAALAPEARDAAAQWADQARQHLTCATPDPEPAPPAPDSDDGAEGDGRGNGTKDRDEGRGDTGPPDDRGEGKDDEGDD